MPGTQQSIDRPRHMASQTQSLAHETKLASPRHPHTGPMAANQVRLVFWETTSGCNLECVSP